MDNWQGKRQDQVRDSEFFVGLSIAGIISILIWVLIYKVFV